MHKLLVIIPFVERLAQHKIGGNYARIFVCNLLITAQIQEQALNKFAEQKSSEALSNRYYLHLPKIADTLARLPKSVLNDKEFRTSLKSPYNAPYFRAIATWDDDLFMDSLFSDFSLTYQQRSFFGKSPNTDFLRALKVSDSEPLLKNEKISVNILLLLK